MDDLFFSLKILQVTFFSLFKVLFTVQIIIKHFKDKKINTSCKDQKKIKITKMKKKTLNYIHEKYI